MSDNQRRSAVRVAILLAMALICGRVIFAQGHTPPFRPTVGQATGTVAVLFPPRNP